MKRIVIALAVVALAAPAMAEWVYTPLEMEGTNTVGIYNPADGTLNDLYITSNSGMPMSATFVVTFGIHVDNAPVHPYGVDVKAHYLHFNFLYDNSSIEVLHAHHLLPWMNSNYDTLTWPNPTSGITGYTTLQQYNITTGGTYLEPVTLIRTEVFPFFQATLHVKSAVTSQLNWFGISVMTVPDSWYLTSPGDLDMTPGMFQYGEGWVHEIPEPSTAACIVGFAFLAGGLVRRARR